MGKRNVIVVAVAVALVAVLGVAGYRSLTSSGSPENPDLQASQLTGMWLSPQGGGLIFLTDGKFTAQNITMNPGCEQTGGAPQSGRGWGTGTWKLGGAPDEGHGTHLAFTRSDRRSPPCEMWTVFSGTDASPEMYLLHDDGNGERYTRAS